MNSKDMGQRPTSPRIHPVQDPGDEVAKILDQTMSLNGEPLNIFSTMAHHPWLLKKFLSLGGQLLNRGTVPDREREIVILRVGWNCQAEYEFGQHISIGLEAGLTQEEISGLTGKAHNWSDGDAILIKMADELCADHCVSDPTYALLAQRWDETALIELVICGGFYQMVSGFLNTFGVVRDQGVPGFPQG